MADAPANRPVSNPWLTAQREWDERFAFHAATARRFFWFGLAALVMGATGLGFGIWAASQSEYVPYLVKVDDLGRAEALPQPATLDEWPTIVIKRELQTFIERARSIPADREILERNLHRLYRFLSTDSPAYRILTDFYQNAATNPIVRWAQETAVVTVTSVTYAGGSSWRVEWAERVSARQTGEVLSTTRYIATLVVGDQAMVDRQTLEINPLGLMIDNIDVQRVQDGG